MKAITIAQVQFLAEKQILQQRQCLRDIAAVPLQLVMISCCRLIRRLLSAVCRIACSIRAVIEAVSINLTRRADTVFIWRPARHVSAQGSRLALPQQRYCGICNRSRVAVTKLEDRHQAARQFGLALKRFHHAKRRIEFNKGPRLSEGLA